jgi:phosphopantothenate-cysteine ligase
MNVVVTGGGTIAPIDDVRAIANASSGRFSAAITEACLRRGANVWHIHTPGALLPLLSSAAFDLDVDDPTAEHTRLAALRHVWRSVRDRLHLVALRTGTVSEYASALREALTARSLDAAFLAMAVSDYEPTPVEGKIASDSPSILIEARRAPKVIRSARDWAPDAYLVGFKLLSRVEPSELIDAAATACRENRVDATVANDLQTLREGRHRVYLVRAEADAEPFGPGPDMADALVERVLTLARARSARGDARGSA